MCCIFLRPHSFWTLHERFIHDSKFATFVSRQVQQVLLDISRAAVQQQITSDAEGPHEQRSEAPRSTSPARPWQPVPELTWVSQTVCRKFGQRLVMQIASWFLDGNQAAMHSEMRWISLYQLYIDYMQCTGEGGPLKLDGWSDPADKPMASLLDISFKQRCIWLKNFSEQLILHTSCVWVPWLPSRLDAGEAWLASRLRGPAKRDGWPVFAATPDSKPVGNNARGDNTSPRSSVVNLASDRFRTS